MIPNFLNQINQDYKFYTTHTKKDTPLTNTQKIETESKMALIRTRIIALIPIVPASILTVLSFKAVLFTGGFLSLITLPFGILNCLALSLFRDLFVISQNTTNALNKSSIQKFQIANEINNEAKKNRTNRFRELFLANTITPFLEPICENACLPSLKKNAPALVDFYALHGVNQAGQKVKRMFSSLFSFFQD